jgi:hypothetical protein
MQDACLFDRDGKSALTVQDASFTVAASPFSRRSHYPLSVHVVDVKKARGFMGGETAPGKEVIEIYQVSCQGQ